MSVIGIDLGTTSSTVAVIRSGGIDIVVNEVSNRRTPTVVGFTDKLRTIGESGYTQRQRNIKNTVSGVKRLLGRKFNDPILQKELPRLGGCNWVELRDGSVGAEVSLRSQQQTFSAQQLAGMLLAHLKDTCESYTKTKASNSVISVPGYFTDAQRRAVLDAAKIAGISCLQVINDTSAVALLYGFYREVENMDSRVMFIDIGAADMSVTIAHFTPNQCQILVNFYDPNLGGFEIDTVLAEYFVNRFMTKYRIDIKSNQRAWQRVMDAVERVKKTLNENDQASINIECILEDRDMNDVITRADYLSLLGSTGIFDRINHLIQNAIAASGLQSNQIDAVEWIGSAMRAVPLQEAVAKAVGRPISATMNAEESVAKGCSLACALVSPLIRLNKKYKLIDIQYSPINLSWNTINDTYDNKETSIELFPKNQQFGKTKFVTITRKEAKPFGVTISYSNKSLIPHMDISDGIIASSKVISIPRDEHSSNRDADVRFKIKLDGSGTTQIVDAEVVEKKEIEVEVPVEKPTETPATTASTTPPTTTDIVPPTTATPPPPPPPSSEESGEPVQTPQEKDTNGDVEMKDNVEPPIPAELPKPAEPPKPEFRKEKRMKTFYTKVPMEIKYLELIPAEIDKAIQMELKLRREDNYAIECANAKNNLEAAVFGTRDKLGSLWNTFYSNSEGDNITDLANMVEDWLYNEGSDERKEEYEKKLNELKLLTDPIAKREYEWERVPKALETLVNTLRMFKSEVANEGDKYSHIDKAELEKVVKKCDEAEAWFLPLLPKQEILTKTETPVFNSSDLEQRNENVIKFCQPILSKPKPTPPPPPKEEPAPTPAPSTADGAGTAENEQVPMQDTSQDPPNAPTKESHEKMDTSE